MSSKPTMIADFWRSSKGESHFPESISPGSRRPGKRGAGKAGETPLYRLLQLANAIGECNW